MSGYDELQAELQLRARRTNSPVQKKALRMSQIILNRLERSGVPCPSLEVRFALPEREFRLDYGWETELIGLEFEGGTFSGGSHTRGVRYESDCEKYSLAAILGWLVVRVTVDMVEDGRMVKLVQRAFESRRAVAA